VFAQALADNVLAAREQGIAEGPLGFPGARGSGVAVNGFCGLVSWALASAAAMVPIVSLE